MSSSPVSICSQSSKPRKPPTITPRRFNKFFDPRLTRERNRSTPACRALRELTSGSTNKKGSISECNDDAFPDLRPAKRRKGAKSILGPDGRATPIPSDEFIPSSPPPSSPPVQWEELDVSSPCPSFTSPYSVATDYGEFPERIYRSRVSFGPTLDFRDQTADFYSGVDDLHSYSHPHAPYCVAACNTNSLLAVGDEQGTVRLIESVRTEKPDFATPYLAFQPHDNAIMHMAFSSDDRHLATGSGDQSCRVVDMSTQTTIRTLAGSKSTVRYVSFQPGNDHVLATCSRDGSVSLYDIRSPNNTAQIQHIVQAHFSDAIGGNSSKSTPSVTSLQFLSQAHSHLFLTSSDLSSHLRLWDIRGRYTARRGNPMPLSTTEAPACHTGDRQYGIVSLASNADQNRVYAVCKDNTVYAYSTNHVILGQAPELDPKVSAFKAQRDGTGLGPLYGLRSSLFRVHSFYVRAAVRRPSIRFPELLAVGSSEGCPVLFPTDERFLRRPATVGGVDMYDVSTALIRGHDMGFSTRSSSKPAKEVTSVAWTSEGELISVADDYRVRCWRQDAQSARDLRLRTAGDAERWGCGWADVESDWDEEDG